MPLSAPATTISVKSQPPPNRFALAFELRDRVSDVERFLHRIGTTINTPSATSKSRRRFTQWAPGLSAGFHPLEQPVSHQSLLGNYDKSVEQTRPCLKLEPANAACIPAGADLYRQETNGRSKKPSLPKLFQRILILPCFTSGFNMIAFLENDPANMANQVAWPGVKLVLRTHF